MWKSKIGRPWKKSSTKNRKNTERDQLSHENNRTIVIFMITEKDLIEFNCRDHSAMVLQVFNPSKASDGLKELEYINGLPLLIRQIIRIKATLANLLFVAFLLAAHLIQGTYIIPDSRHFCSKNDRKPRYWFFGGPQPSRHYLFSWPDSSP